MVSPWGPVDKRVIVAVLRGAGSRDPDAVRAIRDSLVRGLRLPLWLGAGLVAVGAVLGAVRGEPVLGTLLAAVGAWLCARTLATGSTIESACHEFLRTPGD